MNLNDPISELKGIGPKKAEAFSKLKINSIDDLVHYYPKKYLDYSNVDLIKNIKTGPVCLRVKFTQPKTRYLNRGRTLTEAVATDNSGSVLIIWFNQSYRSNSLDLKQEYFLIGNFELSYNRFSIINPSLEKVSDAPLNTARILPIYKETKFLNSKDIRKSLAIASKYLESFKDIYPPDILNNLNLLSHKEALHKIHFPSDSMDITKAKERLAFNAIFDLILSSRLNKEELDHTKSVKIDLNIKLAKEFVEKLPFKLTDDQRKVIWQIMKDLNQNKPMNRLVEGDVGSGKTVIAAMVSLLLIKEGFQVALMAPTELLANQHYTNIKNLFKPFNIEVALLTSSTKPIERQKIAKLLELKKSLMLIGTHALINENLKFYNLAMVTIDEQHRFGVKQRKDLKQKANYLPHLLSLSATPIPRSLALTLFKELNISTLKEKPKRNNAISTFINSKTEYLRSSKDITNLLVKGQQMFIVVPKISSINQNDNTIEKVVGETKKLYPKFRIDYLHGKLKNDLKNQKITNFLKKEIDILVSTTVIEVGIDIPNATVMVIYDSDNFGLAQLHQLRGRIGRGKDDGYCYLIHEDNKLPSRRLEALRSTNNGFELAELDLNIRGPGAIYGELQHGLLDLKLVDFNDNNIVTLAQQAVNMFMINPKNMLKYATLLEKVNNLRKIVNLD